MTDVLIFGVLKRILFGRRRTERDLREGMEGVGDLPSQSPPYLVDPIPLPTKIGRFCFFPLPSPGSGRGWLSFLTPIKKGLWVEGLGGILAPVEPGEDRWIFRSKGS